MGRDLFSHQLTRLRGSVLGWGLGLGALAALVAGIYPSIAGNEELQAYWESLPEAARALSGGAQALTSVSGYFESQLFAFLPLVLAIFTVGKAAQMIAGEEADGTMDIVLAQPVERWRLVTARFAALAGATGVIVTAVALPLVALGPLVGLTLAEIAGLALWGYLSALLALVFGAATLTASAIAHRKRTAVLVGTVVTVGAYVLDAMAPLSEALDGVDVLSPYHWYALSDPVTGPIDLVGLAVLVVLVGVLVAGAVIGFQRKDVGV